MSEDRRPIGVALAATAEQTNFVRHGGPTEQPQAASSSPDSVHAIKLAFGNRETPVPLTTRLSPKIAGALRRAYLEQKLAGRKPDTQQAIVESALQSWLAEAGFID